MKVVKLSVEDELKYSVVVWEYNPMFASTKVIITDEDEVWAIQGSDCYPINFVDELIWVIHNTNGNQGWLIVDEETGKRHIDQVCEVLYSKDYLGIHNYDEVSDKISI